MTGETQTPGNVAGEHYYRKGAHLPLIGPIPEGHDLLGRPCFGCMAEIKAGDYITQILIGPGIDPIKREQARNDEAYEGVALAVHFACATGIESDEERLQRARRYVMDLPVEPVRNRTKKIRATRLHEEVGDFGQIVIAKK